jgi:predicted kinase
MQTNVCSSWTELGGAHNKKSHCDSFLTNRRILMQLIIIRGIPGSGKSTKAREIISEREGSVDHFEADMFFERDGEYRFDPTKLKDAHEWCQNQTRASLEAGRDVIVSNTFVKRWEAQPYLDMAEELGADVKIIICKGEYGSVHGVPEDRIQIMKENFESIPC